MAKILLIDDDEKLGGLLEAYFQRFDLDLVSATHPSKGLELLHDERPDLVILDVMLPDQDGFEVCRTIRKTSSVPIVMLTARGEVTDRIVGLELGADDYLTKPFSVRELVARVKAILRRIDRMAEEKQESESLEFEDLRIDREKRRVEIGGDGVRLTAKEYDLLLQFARYPGRVYTRSQLLDLVWGYGEGTYEHTVNSHINRLRAKIEDDPSQPRYIRTVWGVGYRFFDPAVSDG